MLVPELLTRFSCSQGYALNPHVLDLFQFLRKKKEASENDPTLLDITVGVITNSDDRVPGILSSLGLKVGLRRIGIEQPIRDPSPEEDVNFVVTSYDVGHEKPAGEIFDAAADLACASPARGDWCMHIGDDLAKDLEGAEAASWDGILLCHGQPANYTESLRADGIPYITDLLELEQHISGDYAQAHRQARQMRRGRR